MTLFSKIALKNLWRNKRRSLSTGLAVAAGFAGLCLLGGYILRVEKFLQVASVYIEHSGHISIYKQKGVDFFQTNPRKFQLTGTELKGIETVVSQDPEVEFTSPVLLGMGLISNGVKSVPFMGYGIEPEIEMKIQGHPQVKRWTHELVPSADQLTIQNAQGEKADSISITASLGTLIGRRPPFDALSSNLRETQLAARTFEGDLNAVNATLGFHHRTGNAMTEDTSLVAPLKVFRDLYATDGATYLAVYIHPGASLSKIQKRLTEGLKEFSVDVLPFNDDRISLFYTGTMGFLYIMAGFFVFLIFSAVALSIVNSMTIGILERVREIGTLRALGFTDSQTASLLTLESAYLTLIGLAFGFIMAQVVAFSVNSANIRFFPPGIAGDMQFVLLPETWFCLCVAVPIFILSLICAYIVSKKMMNKPIIQLLQQAN